MYREFHKERVQPCRELLAKVVNGSAGRLLHGMAGHGLNGFGKYVKDAPVPRPIWYPGDWGFNLFPIFNKMDLLPRKKSLLRIAVAESPNDIRSISIHQHFVFLPYNQILLTLPRRDIYKHRVGHRQLITLS